MKDGHYMNILALYHRFVFQEFKSFVRTENDLVEDDIRLVLDEYNSNFITCELEPGNYTFKDLSEVFYNILKPEDRDFNKTIAIEFDDIIMKTKLVVTPTILAIRFNENSFFTTILGFTSCWDYKHYNEYTSQKIVNLSTTNEIQLKCYVIDDSVINGIREPILYTFVLDIPSSYKLFCQPATIHHKRIKKSFLNT